MSAPLESPVGKTSLYCCAARSIENRREDRLFYDPLADVFTDQYAKDFMAAVSKSTGQSVESLAEYVAVRTKFIDNEIEKAVAGGACQIVICGCGADARAWRLKFKSQVKFVYFDLPEVILYREKVINIPPTANSTVISVGIDFNKNESMPEKIQDAGFSTAEPSVWVCEGLLMYMDEPAVESLLANIKTLCAPGSSIVGDVMNENFFNPLSAATPRVERSFRIWDEWSERPRWGTSVPEKFFASAGFANCKYWEYGEIRETDWGRIPPAATKAMLVDTSRSDPNDFLPRNLLFVAS